MNECTKQLLHLRDGRSVHVSIDSDTLRGCEFVRLEFNKGGYVSLECDETGVPDEVEFDKVLKLRVGAAT